MVIFLGDGAFMALFWAHDLEKHYMNYMYTNMYIYLPQDFQI